MNGISLFLTDLSRLETAFAAQAEQLQECTDYGADIFMEFFSEMESEGIFERCGGACAGTVAFWFSAKEGYAYLRTQISEAERAKCDPLLLPFNEPYAFDLPKPLHPLKYGVLFFALSPERCRLLDEVPEEVDFKYAFDLVATLPDPPLGLMHGPAGSVFSDPIFFRNTCSMVDEWREMIRSAARTDRGIVAVADI